jgi:hypothetical protein
MIMVLLWTDPSSMEFYHISKIFTISELLLKEKGPEGLMN